MNQVYDRSLLEGSLSQMESAALNFAQRLINDGKVRMSYINQTRKLSQEYRAKVNSGAITADEAASRYSKLGRGLLVVTIGVAIYNIAVAEDKLNATAREGVIIGGGFAGGAAGGAVAGLTCGPGALPFVSLSESL